MQLHPPAHSNWLTTTPPSLSSQKKYWLNRPGALTAGLRQVGHVGLRVMHEEQGELPLAEAWMLQHPALSPIWIREIVMDINGVDSVFARSVTPLDASQGLWLGMRQLQTRPLADMLYHDPDITRSPFYTCRLTEQQPLYQSARRALGTKCPPAHHLWARCSVFWRSQVPLLVAECFLPDFWSIAASANTRLPHHN